MNPEYTKFTQSKVPYNPPVIGPGHFSNLPDALIPSQHVELRVNPIEKEDNEIIQDIATPPPTPPELDPGLAGFGAFTGAKTHELDPIFKNDAYLRVFMTKICLLDCAYFIPTMIMLSAACFWGNETDIILLRNSTEVWITIIGSIPGVFLYIYAVGLCRNSPFLQIAFVIRSLLTLLTFGMICLLIHYWFLSFHLEKEEIEMMINFNDTEEDSQADHNKTDRHEDGIEGVLAHLLPIYITFQRDHSPPYMGLLIIIMYWVYICALSYFFIKLGYTWSDYRVPILIYTICFTVSPVMVTIVLNNGFKNRPVGYDLFQIMVGTFFLNILGMGTAKHMERILEGRLCPLRKDELLYAALHYGIK